MSQQPASYMQTSPTGAAHLKPHPHRMHAVRQCLHACGKSAPHTTWDVPNTACVPHLLPPSHTATRRNPSPIRQTRQFYNTIPASLTAQNNSTNRRSAGPIVKIASATHSRHPTHLATARLAAYTYTWWWASHTKQYAGGPHNTPHTPPWRFLVIRPAHLTKLAASACL